MQDVRKDHLTSFSPAFSTNEGIIYQNFLTFSFNIFETTLCNTDFKVTSSASPKLSNLNQEQTSK